MSGVLIGIDLGGTNIKAAVVDEDKQVLARESAPTNAAEGVEPTLDRMAALADAVLASAARSRGDVLAVGIGSPGPLNQQTGIVHSPVNFPGWEDVPMAQGLKQRLGIPSFLENDGNTACYGEYWMGAGQGARIMCTVTLGTGVGGGIVAHGKLLRGVDGTAAEVGHMVVEHDGRLCNCGTRGCLEAYASVTGMLRTAFEGLEAGQVSTLSDVWENDPDSITGRMISEHAARGDEYSQSVIETTGAWLGVGVGNLINLLNPEKVVLFGGMTAAGDTLFNPIRESAGAVAFEIPFKSAEIVPAGLGKDSGVLGAAGCALDRLNETA